MNDRWDHKYTKNKKDYEFGWGTTTFQTNYSLLLASLNDLRLVSPCQITKRRTVMWNGRELHGRLQSQHEKKNTCQFLTGSRSFGLCWFWMGDDFKERKISAAVIVLLVISEWSTCSLGVNKLKRIPCTVTCRLCTLEVWESPNTNLLKLYLYNIYVYIYMYM